jgi:iron complex outermembrane receptor protein
VAVDSYTELDLRLAWLVHKGIELAVTGQNLLQDSHQEFRFFTSRWAAPRGVYGRITWKF